MMTAIALVAAATILLLIPAYVRTAGKLRRARAELRERNDFIVDQARLAALGGIVSQLSHQWRQPLNVLALVLQTIEMQAEEAQLDRKALAELLGKGLAEIESLNALLDDYRAYFKPDASKGSFPVGEAIAMALRLHSPALEQLRVKVEVDCPGDLELWGRRSSLVELIVCLVADFLPSFVAVKAPPPTLTLKAGSGPGDAVDLELRGNRVSMEGGGLPLCRFVAERDFELSVERLESPSESGFALRLRRKVET